MNYTAALFRGPSLLVRLLFLLFVLVFLVVDQTPFELHNCMVQRSSSDSTFIASPLNTSFHSDLTIATALAHRIPNFYSFRILNMAQSFKNMSTSRRSWGTAVCFYTLICVCGALKCLKQNPGVAEREFVVYQRITFHRVVQTLKRMEAFKTPVNNLNVCMFHGEPSIAFLAV